MQTNLKYLNSRRDVLAQNIANADVPGYKTKDLEAPDFSSAMKSASGENTGGVGSGVTLTATQPGHISGTINASNFKQTTSSGRHGDVTKTGNNVVLEDEVLKMSKTDLEYQQTADLYKKMLDMLKTAIGNA